MSAGFLVYSNTLYIPFQFDDNFSIVSNSAIRNIRDISAIWKYCPTRFITYLTLALNYTFHQLNTSGYHTTNLIIHISSAFLLYWLTILTFNTPSLKKERIIQYPKTISFFISLTFLLHPIQTEGVTYIAQRSTCLATLFYLASLCLYIKGRLVQNEKPVFISIIYFILSLATGILGLFSKEISITLPLIIVLYEYYFLMPKRQTWKFILSMISIQSSIILIISIIRFINLKKEWVVNKYFIYYCLTQVRVFATYIRLLFIPVNQNLDYDYPISYTLINASVLWGIILLLIIAYTGLITFRKWRLISFGIFWLIITLLPEFIIFPLYMLIKQAHRDIIFEHRLYLPAVGYCIILINSIYFFIKHKSWKVFIAISLIINSTYAILTYSRNYIWRDELSLWNDTVKKSPYKARPYYNRGLAYYYRSDLERAISDFTIAVKFNPKYKEAYYNRGLIFLNMGKYRKAISDFTQALNIDSNYAEAYYNRGLGYTHLGAYKEAVSNFTHTIMIKSDYENAYINRGNIYLLVKGYNKAISDYNYAIEINPYNSQTYYNRGNTYFYIDQYDKAINDYNLAININPNFIEAYNNRGNAYAKKEEYYKAISDYNKALNINKDYKDSYINLITAKTKIKEYYGTLNEIKIDF